MITDATSLARLYRGFRLATCGASALLLMATAAHAELTTRERSLLGGLKAERALQDLRRLSMDAPRIDVGVGEGSVVAGSREERQLAGRLADELRSLGLEVQIEEFPVRAYRYEGVQLLANGASIPSIALHAAGAVTGRRDGVDFAGGNSADARTVRTMLVDAGAGYAADYAAIGDVRGKAVLVGRELRDWPPAQITEADYHGAAAIIFHDHPASDSQPDALRQDSMWGHEQLPTLAISRRAADGLRQQLQRGPVEITLGSHVAIDDGRSRNVLGVLRGSEFPDEWVVVSAHYDRWFRGACDNVSGVAAVLELARTIKRSGLKPRRSMLFLLVGAEEAGLADPERDWLAGSYAFIQQHPEVMRRAALIFNIDLIGWTGNSATLLVTPDAQANQQAVLTDLRLAQTTSLKPTTSSSIDAWTYGVVGGAAVAHLDRSNADYYPVYHTQMDAFRPERFANMADDLRLLTLSLWRAADQPRPGVALTAVADFVDAALAADAARIPEVSFDAARQALRRLRSAAAVLESASAAGVDAASADRLLMSVRSGLVPWLYASNGDFEQVVRTGEHAHRVAVFDAMATALRADDQTTALRHAAELYEGRQCQRLSPAVYAAERAWWAGEGGWASRFGHRAPPPASGFEQLCFALLGQRSDPRQGLATLAALRADSARAVFDALTLITAKLTVATAQLAGSGRLP